MILTEKTYLQDLLDSFTTFIPNKKFPLVIFAKISLAALNWTLDLALFSS